MLINKFNNKKIESILRVYETVDFSLTFYNQKLFLWMFLTYEFHQQNTLEFYDMCDKGPPVIWKPPEKNSTCEFVFILSLGINVNFAIL